MIVYFSERLLPPGWGLGLYLLFQHSHASSPEDLLSQGVVFYEFKVDLGPDLVWSCVVAAAEPLFFSKKCGSLSALQVGSALLEQLGQDPELPEQL